MTPEIIQSLLLYRDAMMLVLNKPSGIPVHSGSGKLSPLDQSFEHLRFGLPKPPALAHRLDKDTSGCLVLGRHVEALRRLGALFANDKIEKTYWAITHNIPKEQEGEINLPLAPQSKKKHLWWMKIDEENGKPSLTHYRVLAHNNQFSWIELTPKTGRTHQLRVHCAAIGCPIVGDRIYGQNDGFENLCLHAYSIKIPLYSKKEAIIVTAPAPDHIQSLIDRIMV
ncbi:RNA pseudouridine synthase [Legionella sp.]|uniref:RluA family pseudouridine synthase n=1 Tax=Legionella sp. TaxID=459 RepID=UPI0032205924